MAGEGAVAKALTVAAEYWRFDLDKARLQLYLRMLGDLDPEDVRGAIGRLVATSRFFPTVAEIRKEVADGRLASVPDAEVAWGEVRRAVAGTKVGELPEWSCAEVAAAVDCIGWGHLRSSSNAVADRARFIETYRGIRATTVRLAVLGAGATPAQRSRRLGGQVGVGGLVGQLVAAAAEDSAEEE